MTAKVKESSHIQSDEALDTIKGPRLPSQKEGVSTPKKGPKNINMLDHQTNKSFGGCVRTTCLDIFYRTKEGNIILS